MRTLFTVTVLVATLHSAAATMQQKTEDIGVRRNTVVAVNGFINVESGVPAAEADPIRRVRSTAEGSSKSLAFAETYENDARHNHAPHGKRSSAKHERHDVAHTNEGALGNVIYGVITNKQARYKRKLRAVMETWAADPAAQGRFLVMGGRDYPADSLQGVTAADCDDTQFGNPCKEASLIAEAARRNASWLFIVGEDNFVDTKLIESALQAERIDVPVGLGYVGCGRGVKDLQVRYGNALFTHGGFCGSCGEALNHAALQRMAQDGRSALVKEYGNGNDCDMATSAAMYKRDIPLRSFPGKLIGTPIFRRSHLEKEIAANAITFHYVTPEAMRWVHAKKRGVAGVELRNIEAAAFEGPKRGCVAGMNGPSASPVWKNEIRACLAEEG